VISQRPGISQRRSRRGGALAAALFALLAALAVGRPLFDPDWVTLAVDTASVQLPWSAVVDPPRGPDGEPIERPRNPALSDQGIGFYPCYRWVLDSWTAGDPPIWNPLLYLGAPGVGNPQYGVLDPQIAVLWPLERAFGQDGFHLGLGWLAWARLFAAGLGAYCLARRLGLLRAGALLAGLAFQSCGFVQLWLNFSLGHVTPFLPWLLYAVEGCRGPRPGRAVVGVALLLAGAVLGGHPETAFYVGAAAGLWSLWLLGSDRRAGTVALLGLACGSLLAFPSVLPFLEYLARSGAQELRAASVATRGFDALALGALIGFAGVVRIAARRLDHAGVVGAARLGTAVLVAVGAFALGMFLFGRGLPDTAGMALLHDLFGAPGRGAGYRGSGTHVEEASVWLPSAALALAFAAALAPTGPLRRRGLVLGLGFGAWWLAQRAPGLLELKQSLPVVGLGATVRLASVSGLMLALLAGEALETAGRYPRRAGALVFIALALAWGRPPAAPVLAPGVQTTPENGELLAFTDHPDPDGRGGRAALEGWIHPELPFHRARARLVRLGSAADNPVGAAGTVMHAPAELAAGPTAGARARAPAIVAAAPGGARWFSSRYLQANRLAPGLWRVEIELLAEDGGTIGTRRAGVVRVTRPFAPGAATVVIAAVGLLWLLIGRCAGPGRGARIGRAVLVALVAIDGALFARGLNPGAPAAEAFPPTATERILARELGIHRFFADPGVLPPDTGLVRGLRALDGYDGLDVASYNAYRAFALQPGVQPLLGWNARGVDLDSPAFRMLGVALLATAAPLEHPRFERVAGPDADAPEFAEAYLYRDREPFPRAFVVPAVASPREVFARIQRGEYDPFALVAFSGEWQPDKPLRFARVIAGPTFSNTRVRLTVEQEGDGVLVVTEQSFPGWHARVNGERRELGTANGVFRALPLSTGTYTIELVYAPRSLRLGLLAALGGALALVVLALLSGRARPDVFPPRAA